MQAGSMDDGLKMSASFSLGWTTILRIFDPEFKPQKSLIGVKIEIAIEVCEPLSATRFPCFSDKMARCLRDP
jgi:hypothetical protein